MTQQDYLAPGDTTLSCEAPMASITLNTSATKEIAMTTLSPAADAVLEAYMNNCGWLDGPFEKDYRCAASVLRAAADQVSYCLDGSDYYVIAKDDLLAIAAELESQ